VLQKKINICCLGDPLSPKTWSGTPSKIVAQLEKKDCQGGYINSAETNRTLELISKYISVIYYRCRGVSRGRFYRYLRSYYVRRAIQKSNVKNTLHFGTLHLPFSHLNGNHKHFLFCDATWHTWSAYSTDMQKYKMLLRRDAEFLEAKSYQQMSHIFSISEYVKDDLVNHYGIKADKVSVVGTGRGSIEPYWGPKDYNRKKLLDAYKAAIKEKYRFYSLGDAMLLLNENSQPQ